MIKSVTVTNHLGESITLELRRPELSGFLIKEITGLGPVEADINTSDLALMDGAIINSTRLQTRNIVFTLGFIWGDDDIETLRHLSYKYFPVKRKVTLLFETDYRKTQIEGYVETNEVDIFNDEGEETEISIICPDPNFYYVGDDGSLIQVISEFYGITPNIEFVYDESGTGEKGLDGTDIEFSLVETDNAKNISYEGDMEVGFEMIMYINGIVEYITITNLNTNGKMIIDTDKIEDLTDCGLIKGDTLYISTIKGQKSATLLRYGETFNILNCINKDAEWFQLSKGDNPYAVTCDYGADNLKFSIQGKIAFDGV